MLSNAFTTCHIWRGDSIIRLQYDVLPLKQKPLSLPLLSCFFNQLFILSTPLLQKKPQNQTKPKIVSVKENKPAFLRKLLAAYQPNFSLCQVRRQKWRIKLAGDQLDFYSTNPVWFGESSWVTTEIAKHCNIDFNCAKQAWYRATTRGSRSRCTCAWHDKSLSVSAIFRKPPATADLHVTEPRHKEGTSLLIETCFVLLKASASPSLQWVTTVH